MLMAVARHTKRLLKLAVLLCLPLTMPMLMSQVEQGRFVGRVTDPSGAAITGAIVIARNTDTNIELTSPTNSTGDYVITPVPSGNYVLTVAANGFDKAA